MHRMGECKLEQEAWGELNDLGGEEEGRNIRVHYPQSARLERRTGWLDYCAAGWGWQERARRRRNRKEEGKLAHNDKAGMLALWLLHALHILIIADHLPHGWLHDFDESIMPPTFIAQYRLSSLPGNRDGSRARKSSSSEISWMERKLKSKSEQGFDVYTRIRKTKKQIETKFWSSGSPLLDR